MVEDTLITGSDAVLACHAGRVQSVEYSTFDKGIINHRSPIISTRLILKITIEKQ